MAASPKPRTLVAPLASLVWLVSALSVSAQETSVAPTVLTPVSYTHLTLPTILRV